jgi:hypothetical protein
MVIDPERSPFLAAEFSHVGYITKNFDQAKSLFDRRHGVRSFMDLGEVIFPNAAGIDVGLRIGLGYVGPNFIELIEPLSGPLDVYHETLAKSSSPFIWHHVCYSVTSQQALDGIRQAVLARGQSIAFANQAGDFFYADTRPMNGHYTEYVALDEQRIAMHEALRTG